MWKILALISIMNVAAKVACLVAGRMENLNTEGTNSRQRKYSVLIDAGSSGSRMFVYTWNIDRDGFTNYSTLKLFTDRQGKPLVLKVTPGLSSFHGNLGGVRSYIAKLLDVAAAEIPRIAHKETPVFVLATAGMRLIPQNEQDTIWNEVRHAIRGKYAFHFKDSFAETITGDEEALFGWVAINFILETFSTSGGKRSPTRGMLDMGGASVQISFEIPQDQPAPKESTVKFEFVTTEPRKTLQYRIFSASYLNYGMQEFRIQYARETVKTYLQNNRTPGIPTKVEIEDPCINRNLTVTQNISLDQSTDASNGQIPQYHLTVDFVGAGDFDSCYQNIIPLLKMRTSCAPLVCTINGNARPDVDLSPMEFYGLSEYFYSLHDVMAKDEPYYKYDVMAPKVKALCAETWQEYLERLKKEYPTLKHEQLAEIIRLKMLICFKSVYVLASIHEGFQFPRTYDKLHPVTQVRGTEIQWNLGALVHILNMEHRKQIQESFTTKIAIVIVSLFVMVLAIIFIVLIIMRERQCHKSATLNSVIERIHLSNKPQENCTTELGVNHHSSAACEP